MKSGQPEQRQTQHFDLNPPKLYLLSLLCWLPSVRAESVAMLHEHHRLLLLLLLAAAVVDCIAESAATLAGRQQPIFALGLLALLQD